LDCVKHTDFVTERFYGISKLNASCSKKRLAQIIAAVDEDDEDRKSQLAYHPETDKEALYFDINRILLTGYIFLAAHQPGWQSVPKL
jgi:hypothetical protein